MKWTKEEFFQFLSPSEKRCSRMISQHQDTVGTSNYENGWGKDSKEEEFYQISDYIDHLRVLEDNRNYEKLL
jgi:hypothetical protein